MAGFERIGALRIQIAKRCIPAIRNCFFVACFPGSSALHSRLLIWGWELR